MRTFIKNTASKAASSVWSFFSRKQLEEKLDDTNEHLSELEQELADARAKIKQYETREMKRKSMTVTITKVVDGDTIHGDLNGVHEKFRFLNIDTPERGESLWRVATDALKKLVHPGKVRVAYETPGEPKRDNFGRLLVYVFNQRGQIVNVELVRAGLSRYVEEYGESRYAEHFKKAYAEAQRAERGIFAPDYVRKPAKKG